MKGKDI